MHTLIHICGWAFIGLVVALLIGGLLVFALNKVIIKAFESVWKDRQ